VSKRWRPWAYAETALPIGHAQTLTPPSLVAYMTEQLDVQPHHRVLEVGTGCGYQAAILGRLAKSVYTVEIVGALGRRARTALRRLNSTNVQVRIGDGFRGWPEAAPFDRILVTCSPEEVPAPLLAQLAEGGCLIAPLGAPYQQTLYRFTKSGASVARQALLPTVFVPMTGEAAAKRTRTADPLHPILSNGSFEQTERETGQLAGWYHQKQLSREHAPDAPGGKAYVTFRNAEPGRAAHAAQAFPVDGHRVRRLKIAGWAKSDNVRPGTQPNQIAALVVAFYDANRALVAEQAIGDWRGTSTWQPFESRVDVPPGAREAVAMIGLHGATGRLSFALLTLEADSPREGAAASRD
jgi:protein-L-isoaspartate(D-aspartate) O-methyltransferase